MVDQVNVKMSFENHAKLMKMREDREYATRREWTLDDLLESLLIGQY